MVRRRSTRAFLAVTAVAAFAVVFVAASGAVSGSTFESNDGNLVVNGAAGSEDWANAPSRTRQDDLTGSSQDNALGQGTKEDAPNVSVVQGSIPPNKSDLSRFYTSTEKVGGNTFLYLAWERTNVLGSANMDVEMNQVAPTFPAAGAVTIARTAGDLLLTYDFTNGGAKPVLGLLTWVTGSSVPTVSGFATNTCFSSNNFPCWGDRIDLGGVADGAINTGTVTDPIANASLAGSTFGEMGVNLTQALPNVFGPNPSACESFGSAYLKSRSSASFSAEIKDFVTPQKISVSNCGYVLVHKTAADTGADQAGASFTIAPGKTTTSGTNTSDAIPGVSGHDGYYCVENLLTSGSYTVTETAAPSGYDVPGSPAHSSLSATPGSCADVSYANAPTATTSFVDPVSLGYVLVRKTAGDSGAVQAGATFTIAPGKVTASGTNGSDSVLAVAGHDGYYCVDHLRLGGTFSVTETAAPSGYAIPSPASHTGVTPTSGSCANAAYSAAGASTSYIDPLALGYVLVHKTAGDTGNDQAGATFVITPGKVTANGTNGNDTVPGVADHGGYYCIDNLRLVSTFSVTETAAPPGYDLPSQATQGNLSATAGSCADVSYASAPTAAASFVDPLALGAILITKTGKDKSCVGAANPAGCSAASTRLLSGAGFRLISGGAVKYTSGLTGAAGTVCISGVVPGSYTLHESTVPSGFAAADDQTVTISGDTTCGGTGTSAPTAAGVVDQPLTTIYVKTNPAVAGTTESTVNCTPGESTTFDANAGHTTGSLTPGTYTCTVVIDP